jgi:uncharacterized coiled-coil protein SlyX
VVQHAEEIAAAEQDRIITGLADTLREAQKVILRAHKEIGAMMAELLPMLDQFAHMAGEAEQWEDEQIAAFDEQMRF